MATDYQVGDTIYKEFSTRAFATGIPTTLAGVPVVSWSENGGANDATGVTLSVDLNTVTGNHLLTIVATGSNGFEDGKQYNLKITTGTVGGVSVVGEKVGEFTLGFIKTPIRKAMDLIESQRPYHSHISLGNIFYVDPVNGDTHANGNRGGILDPYLTIQDCHDNAVTTRNHDLILLVPGHASTATTHTVAATTTISKDYVFIRGVGRDFIVTRSGAGDTFALTGEGVELEGFQLGTAATGSGNGVSVTGDFALIHNLWINDTQGDGINLNQCDNCIIEENRFQNTGAGGSGDGVEINGTGTSSNNNIVRKNIFEQVTGDAIKLTGGTITDTIIDDNTIHGSTGWGINIATGTDTVVKDNDMGNNASGDITDSGTDTVNINNENRATATALAVVDGNVDSLATQIGTAGDGLTDITLNAASIDLFWDEDISKAVHDVPSSGAKILRQGGDLAQIDGAVSDVSPSKTSFDTNLTQVDGYFDDAVMIFSNGSANAGIGVPVSAYLNASGNMTFLAPDTWPVTPVDGDDFIIFATHVHPVAQITADIDANSTQLNTTLPALIDDLAVKKNATFTLHFEMVLASDHVTPATGLTVTGQAVLDSGSYGAVAGTITEISNGTYRFDALAADTNGDMGTWRFSSATADDTKVSFKTVA